MEKNSFKELRKIDVTEHMEKKGQFTYLSWSWAVDTLLQHDPEATWDFKEPYKMDDGSMMVFCTMTAFGKTMNMQMPVLDHRNNAIKNPNAFHLNTAMQRCLAKIIAVYGIGLHIYSGEDLPPDDAEDTKKPKKPYKPEVNEMGLEEFQMLLDTINTCEEVAELEAAKESAKGAWLRLDKQQKDSVADCIEARNTYLVGAA